LKLKNKKLLIFDLDGTLVNSALDLAQAVNYMLEKLDRETFSEEIIHRWVGNGAVTLVKRALSGSRTVAADLVDEDYIAKALKIFLDYYGENLCNATVPYPNVSTTLTKLKENYTLAIVTNKPFAFVSPILKGLDMDDLFALILGGDSMEKKKTGPTATLACM
jgi:phosphoglycolate phosphatase